MFAPRFFANPSSSRMSIAAPSPMTNPSRSLSNGRDALAGSPLRVERAFIAQNPPSPMGVMVASDPPAITASQTPRRIASNASPMAWLDAAQAVVVVMFGPFAPYRIPTGPGGGLERDTGG